MAEDPEHSVLIDSAGRLHNCEAMADYHGACAYATVILSLFDDDELAAEAQKTLDSHREAGK